MKQTYTSNSNMEEVLKKIRLCDVSTLPLNKEERVQVKRTLYAMV